MSKTYLATLTPLEPFFFGGSRTFNSGDEAAYFVRSEYFPQQTGMLGALRYYLLKQADKLNSNDKDLIGGSSFDIDTKTVTQKFGKLRGLSPVFLHSKDELRFVPQLRNGSGKEPQIPLPLAYLEGQFLLTGLGHDKIYFLKDYTAKDGNPDRLVSNEGSSYRGFDFKEKDEEESNNGVFRAIEKTGIKKTRNGQMTNEAFYVQTKYKLDDGWSFGCYVSFADYYEPVDDTIPIGGESALFRVTFKGVDSPSPAEAFLNDLTGLLAKQPPEILTKIILLSDTIIPPEVYTHTEFTVTETVDFQFIVTPPDTENFAPLSRRGQAAKQRHISAKYSLLKRGSILYCKPEKQKAITALLDIANYQAIGFNIYTIIPAIS